MKKRKGFLKKILGTVAAFAMTAGVVSGSVVPVLAAGEQVKTYTGTGAGTGSITISNAVEGATYKVYKLFDATVAPLGEGETSTNKVAYTAYTGDIPTGLESYFTKDDVGNITATAAATKTTGSGEAAVTSMSEGLISALKTWASSATPLGTATVSNGNTSLKFEHLPYGYYYVSSTIGTAVSVTSTNPAAQINDKNQGPDVDKIITKVADANAEGSESTRGSVDVKTGETQNKRAIAEAGSTVSFKSTITKRAGGLNYVYHDTMGRGLKFNTDSVVVTVNSTTVTTGTTTFTVNNTPGNGETFTVSFDNNYINGLINGTQIEISYSAVVTSDALQTAVEAGKNKAKVTYGDNNSHSTVEKETQVYNAKISVVKREGTEDGGFLPDAGFVLSREKSNQTQYYKISYVGTSNTPVVSWVNDINDATEYFSGSDGKLHDKENGVLGTTEKSFSGLADGTYKLVEKTVPAGYNKAEDKEVTVGNATSTSAFEESNLSQQATIVNRPGTLLPSTGGIGTTIFYIAGGILIIGAVALMINRKKKANA